MLPCVRFHEVVAIKRINLVIRENLHLYVIVIEPGLIYLLVAKLIHLKATHAYLL